MSSYRLCFPGRQCRCLISPFLLGLVIIACLWSPEVQAAPWLKLDRATIEPSWFPNRALVRVYVSAISLVGEPIAVPKEQTWELRIGNSKQRLPPLIGRHGNLSEELHVQFVIETAYAYSDAIARIRHAIGEFIEQLPDSSRVGILGYGQHVSGRGRLVSAHAAVAALSELDVDVTPADNVLVEAMQEAVRSLRRSRRTRGHRAIRQIIVVVSDGQDIDPTPNRYRLVAKRANRLGIRIHSLAYSPSRHRAPMLGLAEMSKRSHGTFRLVLHTERSFHANFNQLARELQDQYVLSYFVPIAKMKGSQIRVAAAGMISNAIPLPETTCAGQPPCAPENYCLADRCVRPSIHSQSPLFRWLLIAGGLLGIFVLYCYLRPLFQRLRPAQPLPPARPTTHQIVPQGPQGQSNPSRSSSQAPASGYAAMLLVLNGPYAGQRLALRNRYTIGARKKSDLVLNDPLVAGHHARFLRDRAGLWWVVDNRSRSGTFVNGVRIRKKQLTSGMLVRIGSSEVRFLQQG